MSTREDSSIEVITVESIDHLTKTVNEIYRNTGSTWWFRGHPVDTWTLKPKIWRDEYDPQQERYLTNLFYQESKLRHSRFPADDDYAGWLALMQHYGLPTRLLDWSKSLLVALFFATRFDRDMRKEVAQGDAAIWMLQPERVNESQGYEAVFPSLNARGIAPMIDEAFKTPPTTLGEVTPVGKEIPERAEGKRPPKKYGVIAAVPSNHDLRMLMQKGTFTIHTTTTSLEDVPGAGTWLMKLRIPAQLVSSLALDLKLLGVDLQDVFPDLEHLAIELTNMHRPRQR